MAEAVGFEPTCPCGQLHFECSSLQPLRYASMYKYSLLGTNHMISSQSRYDHFDTSPYLSQHQHLRKRGELMGRTSKNIKLRIPEKPRKIKGFRSGSYRVATTISSQSRYDHFDTAPYLSQHQHLGKRGELMGRTSKNIKLRTPVKPHKIKGFRSGSYRVATTISSQGRYNHFDTAPNLFRPFARLASRRCT